MSNILDGFTGKIPSGISIEENVRIALDATKNMSAFEKAKWLRNQIGPNKIWDYKKTIGSEYENFGNFNYGVVAKALFNKEMVLAGAGGTQYSSKKDYLGSLYVGTAISLFYENQDNKEDIPFVEAGIQAANKYLGLSDSDGVGFDELFNDVMFKDYYKLTQSERQGLAYQISSGNNSGVLYAAYNQDRSLSRYDPLVLDLNADGVKTISQQTSKAFFDLSGDGMSEQTGWIDSNDGFLVFDKNANGKIDDINELFGKSNLSGFSELKELFDANNDNLIDYKDTNYAQLKVWQDINSFIKSIKNNRFYKADFFDLNLRKIA